MSEHLQEQTLPQIPPDGNAAPRPLGVLEVERAGRRFALPLASIEYRASVCERVADVTLTEVFENPYTEHLEAVYTFPLSGGSAVRAFTLEVAGRSIHGVVKERGEARAEYQRAIEAGKRAAMLEQERDNVFTVQVGNLPPGERATVTITYAERLDLVDDARAELRLPLVVAPRYVPGAPLDRQNSGSGVEDDTDQVPDASRVTPPRLAPGTPAGPTVRIEVTLVGDASTFADLASSQHATAVSFAGGGLVVRLAKTTERANCDFVLQWRFAGERVRSSLTVYRHPDRGLFGMLTVAAPPAADRRVMPRDVVFLLDRSGSMQGLKMQSAARACAILLESLGPHDRYAIAAFDNAVEWMGGAPTFATADESGRMKGEHFLRTVDARGGTEIAPALDTVFGAIDREARSSERTPVVVVITDGEVSNEGEVLGLVKKKIGRARLFAVGIDTAVNDALMRRMAAAGRGSALMVAPGAELEEALGAIAREIGAPEVFDLTVDDLDAGLGPDRAPERFPDLFSGRAATVFVRLQSFGAVRLRGKRADGRAYEEEIRAVEADVPAIAHLWARARITDLEDRYRADVAQRGPIKQQIVDLSIAHQIVTRFTAYLAIDDAEVVNPGGTSRHVVQPVDMPAAWEMNAAPPMPSYIAAPSAPPPMWGAPTMSRDEQPMAKLIAPKQQAPAPPQRGFFKSLFGKKDQASSRLAAALEALARMCVEAVARIDRGEGADADAIERARVDAIAIARAESASDAVAYLETDVAELVALLRTSAVNARARALVEALQKRYLPFWEV